MPEPLTGSVESKSDAKRRVALLGDSDIEEMRVDAEIEAMDEEAKDEDNNNG